MSFQSFFHSILISTLFRLMQIEFEHSFECRLIHFQYYLNVCKPLVPQYGLSCAGGSAGCRAINDTLPEHELVRNKFQIASFALSVILIKLFHLLTNLSLGK